MPFAWVAIVSGVLWFKFIPAAFAIGLTTLGLFLILQRRSPFSNVAKALITAFTGVLVVGPIMLDVWIRSERQALENRAKEFLSRPVPDMFQTDSIEGYQAPPGQTVLSTSRFLIERYAGYGRIRWSAVIQGQFAIQPLETRFCEDAASTNEAARIYAVACKAIIDKEWEMRFWQWVEDTIELKRTIPEIEEEDRVDSFIQQIDGIWTNGSGTMTISPNGTFLALWSSPTQTNVLRGTQMFRCSGRVIRFCWFILTAPLRRQMAAKRITGLFMWMTTI